MAHVACGGYVSACIDENNAVWASRPQSKIKSDVCSIAAGASGLFCIDNEGAVWKFGKPWGVATGTDYQTKIRKVQLNVKISQISCGESHTLMLSNDFTVYSYGKNTFGELGIGNTTEKKLPQELSYLGPIHAISCIGNFSLFLTAQSTVFACGDNSSGQLGMPKKVAIYKAREIPGLTEITAISSGSAHSLFLKSNGTVLSCGYFGNGQLGYDTIKNQRIPKVIPSLTNIEKIACGMNSSYFINYENDLYSCGHNHYGQLGLGDEKQKQIPTLVQNIKIQDIFPGWYHLAVLDSSDNLLGCGRNTHDQVSAEICGQVSTLTKIPEFSGITVLRKQTLAQKSSKK